MFSCCLLDKVWQHFTLVGKEDKKLFKHEEEEGKKEIRCRPTVWNFYLPFFKFCFELNKVMLFEIGVEEFFFSGLL